MYQTIRADLDRDLLIVQLNRPDRMNAFTVEMCDELVDVFQQANKDDRVRAVVVTGAGKAFCAGMDLAVEGNVFGLNTALDPSMDDMVQRLDDPLIARGVRDTGGKVALAIFECLKPVVGAINGVAVGIGSTMLLPMDFRIASDQARFGFVFGRLGITMEACSSWFLPRIVGVEQALEWVYRANIFDAEEALAKKLVRAVHPADRLLDEACAFARMLVTDRSPVAVALMRQSIWRNHAEVTPLKAHLVESLAVFSLSTGDGQEGVRAFHEKRTPAFTGRASQMPNFYPWS